MDLKKEQLMAMTKEQLIELLELALQASTQANQNSLTLTNLMTKMNTDFAELKDKYATLEAEAILLRNRP
jgi:hypothetical protein